MDFKGMAEYAATESTHRPDEPFIAYRDKDGGWHCDYTQNQYGATYDWVEDVKSEDPFAYTFTGETLENGGLHYAYNTLLCNRLRIEFQNAAEPLGITSAEYKKQYALIDFFEDNIVFLSDETKGYLTLLDRPFAELMKICPFDMTPYQDDMFANMDIKKNVVAHIENAVNNRLHISEGKPTPAKRNIEGYTEMLSIQLNGETIALAENPKEADLYLICNITKDNPLGIEESRNIQITDDYLGALREFTYRIDRSVENLRAERRELKLPVRKMTLADCATRGNDEDWKGKVLIVKPEAFAREYRSAENQLILCTGGFGSNPNARGKAVFAMELHSGKEMRYERHQITGIADLSKLPNWATDKLAALQKEHEPDVSASSVAGKEKPHRKTPDTRKPSLLGRLDGNKQKVERDKAGSKDRPPAKKRNAAEVTG